jgi:hypothetical protein
MRGLSIYPVRHVSSLPSEAPCWYDKLTLPEHGATFDALTVRNPDKQLFVLTYNRQPEGRWLMEYGPS